MKITKIEKQIKKNILPIFQKHKSKKLVLCVTGPMAAGKNFVCTSFENLKEIKFISIDLDKEVHKIINDKTKELIEAFQESAKEKNISLLGSDNFINRKALGALLFSNPKLLKKQEEIIYPALTKNVNQFIQEYNQKNNEHENSISKGIIINATVLFKIPELLNECDFIVYVHANKIKRFFRIKKRDKLKCFQIFKRFTAQKNIFGQYKKTGKQIILIKN